jgi:hypothetical protein
MTILRIVVVRMEVTGFPSLPLPKGALCELRSSMAEFRKIYEAALGIVTLI